MTKRILLGLVILLSSSLLYAAQAPSIYLSVSKGDTVRLRMKSARKGAKIKVKVNGKTEQFSLEPNDQREWEWVTSQRQIVLTGEIAKLDCSDNGQSIVGVSIQSHTTLKELDCSNCALASLALHGNTQLEEIDCHNSQLSSLDLRENPKLEKITCARNRLTALSLSGLKALEELDCENNKLSALKLEGLDALEKLNCRHNGMTDLVIPENKTLEWIACDGNDFGPRAFILMVRRLPVRRASNPGYLKVDGVYPKLAQERNWKEMQ